jgi:hypothetical protein
MEKWILSLFAMILISGCTISQTPTQVPQHIRSEVLSYSDQVAASMLSGLNQVDYALFSANVSDSSRTRMNQDWFQNTVSLTRSSVGRYLSTDADPEVTDIGPAYRIIYQTRFTEDYPVRVTMEINKTNTSNRVLVFSLDSRKLSGRL